MASDNKPPLTVENSSIPTTPSLIKEKVIRVRNAAQELHDKADREGMELDEVLKGLFENIFILTKTFGTLTTAVGLNNSAVSLARAIAEFGFSVSQHFKNGPNQKTSYRHEWTRLYNASVNLMEYCGNFEPFGLTMGLKDATFGKPSVRQSSPVDPQLFENLLAQSKEMERAFVGMEARLAALGETADKAVVRVEEITAQQADAIRVALTKEANSIANGFEDTHQNFQTRLSEFDGYRDQAKALLSEMAAEALAGGHIESAKEEEVAANLYRKWALWAMIAGLCVIGVMLLAFKSEQFTWPGLVNRAMVSLLFVIPTAYLARESAKHRAQAIELRRASLDFAALEPFLKGLEGEEGLKVRAELARRAFFAGNPVDASSSYGVDPQAIIMKGMDTIADLAKRRP